MLNPRDAQASNIVLTGTLTICSRQALVLFDSGATHSLVSPSFALCLDMRFAVLNSLLTVLTPVGWGGVFNNQVCCLDVRYVLRYV